MIIIKSIEDATKENNFVMNPQMVGLNSLLYWSYRDAQKCENELINFNEPFLGSDFEEITNFFKKENITEFTISSTYSGLISMLALLEQNGFEIGGMIMVNSFYKKFETDEWVKMPAIKMVAIN